MIFVDTGAWFATFVPDDPDHRAAYAWVRQNAEPLITTDYVVDELLTLLKARGEMQRARRIGELLLHEQISTIVWVGQKDIFSAWRIFRDYRDQRWSFTDCVSRAVIERLSIRTAFAFDEHFRQFGIVDLVPSDSTIP